MRIFAVVSHAFGKLKAERDNKLKHTSASLPTLAGLRLALFDLTARSILHFRMDSGGYWNLGTGEWTRVASWHGHMQESPGALEMIHEYTTSTDL